MEKRKHYWNGRWGRLARQDVLLYVDLSADGGRWTVEHRTGGVEGRRTSVQFRREDTALDRLHALLVGDDWRDLM